MANLILYQKGSSHISFFIRDCIKKGNRFEGSNCTMTGVKPSLFDHTWTHDELVEIDPGVYDKKVSEVTIAPSSDNTHIDRPNYIDYRLAAKRIERIASMGSSDINNYVDGNVFDLITARDEFKRVYKTIQALCSYINYKIKE